MFWRGIKNWRDGGSLHMEYLYLLIQKQFIPCLPWFILLTFWSIVPYEFTTH